MDESKHIVRFVIGAWRRRAAIAVLVALVTVLAGLNGPSVAGTSPLTNAYLPVLLAGASWTVQPTGFPVEVEPISDDQLPVVVTAELPNGQLQIIFTGLRAGGTVWVKNDVEPIPGNTAGVSALATSYIIEAPGLDFDQAVVCIPYTDAEVVPSGGPSHLRMLQLSPEGIWVDVTLVPTDIANDRVCGVTQHLSHFALAKYIPLLPPTTQRLGSVAGLWASNGVPDEALADLGVRWSRVTVEWITVQPNSADDANFDQIDLFIDRASGSGSRRLHVMVTNNPEWAAASHCNITTDEERENLANLMTLLVNRYKDQVGIWMLYSEIERVGHCFGTGDEDNQPTQEGRDNYAKMVEVVGDAIHAADPDAKLITTGLVSGNFAAFGCPQCGFDGEFLNGMLRKLKEDGKLDSLDYVAVHWYSSQAGQDPTAEYHATNWSTYGGIGLVGRISKIRRDMLDVGLTVDELKPIIVAEASYTGLNPRAGSPIEEFLVEQRNYVPKLLARATFVDVMSLYWFMYTDAPIGTGGGDDNLYGLLNEDRITKKPSFYAYQEFTARMPGDGGVVTRVDSDDQRLEGYDFSESACGTGERLQIVWNQASTESLVYLLAGGDVMSVADSLGNSVTFDGNTVIVDGEPKYICYLPSS